MGLKDGYGLGLGGEESTSSVRGPSARRATAQLPRTGAGRRIQLQTWDDGRVAQRSDHHRLLDRLI